MGKTKISNSCFERTLADGAPIRIPFGKWEWKKGLWQSFARPEAESIAKILTAYVAAGNPGIPVYQGHPDVPELAAKYPDKGALGWIVKMEVDDGGVDCLVEWDRFPMKGFGWFSPYWFGEMKKSENGENVVVVDEIQSLGLVNKPRIQCFRLPNEDGEIVLASSGACDACAAMAGMPTATAGKPPFHPNCKCTAAVAAANEQKGKTMNADKVKQLLGLAPEATDGDIEETIALWRKEKEERAVADAKAEADRAALEDECAKARKALEDECGKRKALEDECGKCRAACENAENELAKTKEALANEAQEHEKLKKLKTESVTLGLPNEAAAENDRMAIVGKIQRERNCSFDTAWTLAKTSNPALFA